MKSPFPGMDPYLEQHWGDVHHRFITYACDVIQSGIPDDLRARVEERVFVESTDGVERAVYPDVRVIERGGSSTVSAAVAGGVGVADPLVVHLGDEPVTQGFIEIIDAGSGNRVVTVIEVLSLSNKLPGEGQDLCLKNQRELKEGRVSLVEIDLLRSGKRQLSVPTFKTPPSYRMTYQVCVRRGWQTDRGEVYRAPLRERLPVIPIPLRQTDADLPLDLQALIDQCYRNGRCDDLDYRREPDPPLEEADASWAAELLRGQGRR